MRYFLKKDKSVLLLSMMLLYPAIGNYIWKVFSFLIPINFNLFTFFVWLIVLICCIPFIIKSIKWTHMLFYVLISFVFVLFWYFTDYDAFDYIALCNVIFFTIPAFFIGLSININDKTFKPLYFLSIFVLFASIIYSFYYLSDRELSTDNMDYAYKVLPSVLIIASSLFIYKKKFWNIILLLISLFFLIALGTRGPILCLIIFILIMFWKKNGFTKLFIYISFLSIVAFIVLWSPLYEILILKISEFLENLGFSSRVLEMLIQKKLSEGNGRDAIKDKLWMLIKEYPILIRGPFSDREATKNFYDPNYFIRYENGTYAHNIILEFIFDFGIIIGILLLIIILFYTLKLVLKVEKDSFYIVGIVICCSLIHLLISGSYLTSSLFFMLIGLQFNKKLINKRKKELII